MHYIETFLTIMKSADGVVRAEERSVRGRHGGSARAAAKIYREAFLELEAEGIPVAYSEDGSRYIETDGSVYFLQNEAPTEKTKTAEEFTMKEIDDTQRLAYDLFYSGDIRRAKKEEKPAAVNTSGTADRSEPVHMRISPDESSNIREPQNISTKTTGTKETVKEDVYATAESVKSGPAADTNKNTDPVLEEFDYVTMDDEEEGTTALAVPHGAATAASVPDGRDEEAGPESAEGTQETGGTPEETGVFSMRKEDFTMCYMKVEVDGPGPGKKLFCEIITSPLTPGENPNDIMAVLIMNGRQYAAATMNGRNGVLVEAEGLGFIIEGLYDEEGAFKATVRLRNLDKKAGWDTRVVDTRVFGKNGHIMIRKGGTTVHIVPLSFYNNSTGNADYFCCYESDTERKTGYTADTDHVPLVCDGKDCDLVCRWHEDGTLYAMITSPETIDLRKEAMG